MPGPQSFLNKIKSIIKPKPICVDSNNTLNIIENEIYLIVSDLIIRDEDKASYWFSRAEDKTFHKCQVTWKREAMNYD